VLNTKSLALLLRLQTLSTHLGQLQLHLFVALVELLVSLLHLSQVLLEAVDVLMEQLFAFAVTLFALLLCQLVLSKLARKVEHSQLELLLLLLHVFVILRDAGLEQTDFLVLRVHGQLALRLRLHQPALELPLQGLLFLPVLPVQTLQVLFVLLQQVLVKVLLLQKLQLELVTGLLVLLPEQVLLLLEVNVGLLQRLGLLAQVFDLAVLLLDVVAHLREPALVLLNHNSRFVQLSL
jgi:hypothetical protein